MSRTRSRLFLIFLAAVCCLPLVLSYAFYYVWKPERMMNYGELLDMSILPPLPAGISGGSAADPSDGRWILLQVDGADCGESCQRRLYVMRQSRLAMGMKKDKLDMVWLVDGSGTPSAGLLAADGELRVLAADPNFERNLPRPYLGHIFLLDPARRLVLRYPEQPDPARMIRDLARLLDVKRM